MIWVLKIFIFALIIGGCTALGIIYAKRYSNRVLELKEMKNALNMFENKIKFTYEDIPTVFKDISKTIKGNIGKVFENASNKMINKNAGEAWEEALNVTFTALKQEDIEIIKGLGRMLGKTDINGQISEIELVNEFLETQIKEAEYEKNKNYKMYKTLGIVVGIAIVIILI